MKPSNLKKYSLGFVLLGTALVMAAGTNELKKMVFEEQRIEGKIRRPQLVLIKADERPDFKPMVLQSLGKNGNFTSSVDQGIIEKSSNQGPFKFDGTRIINYVP